MGEKRRCDTCNVEISKTNWTKHIKTKKTLQESEIPHEEK
jgi:hypothetical protein